MGAEVSQSPAARGHRSGMPRRGTAPCWISRARRMGSAAQRLLREEEEVGPGDDADALPVLADDGEAADLPLDI
jgi:hypothetical protein